MKIWDDLFTGGGGDFVTRFVSAIQVLASGASGDLVTLTPPSGQRVKLTSLVATALETGITITVNGSDVITSKILAAQSGNSESQFTINGFYSGSGTISDKEAITGDTDEVIVIKKDSGSTTAVLVYNYHFGV